MQPDGRCCHAPSCPFTCTVIEPAKGFLLQAPGSLRPQDHLLPRTESSAQPEMDGSSGSPTAPTFRGDPLEIFLHSPTEVPSGMESPLPPVATRFLMHLQLASFLLLSPLSPHFCLYFWGSPVKGRTAPNPHLRLHF